MPKIVDWDARRDEILSATWRVIARDGIAGATIRAIAREANCSRGYRIARSRSSSSSSISCWQAGPTRSG